MSSDYRSEKSIRIRFRMREFAIPVVRDGVVLGKKSPIGCEAMRKAMRLMHTNDFEHIEFEDDVISDILVRANILRRIPRDCLIRFVTSHIKPMMSDTEVLHFELDVDVELSQEL